MRAETQRDPDFFKFLGYEDDDDLGDDADLHTPCEEIVEDDSLLKRAYDTSPIFAVPLRQQIWRKDAACLNSDVDKFFPGKGDARSMLSPAQAVCNSCVVIEECEEFAVSENQEGGVWAAKSPKQLKDIRIERKHAS